MRIATVCAPFLAGCTILTDLDALQFVKDGGVIVDAPIADSPSGMDGSTSKDASDGSMMMSDASDAMMPIDTGVDSGTNVWMDDFNRADSNSVGNGWIMKTAGAIHIKSNRAEEENSPQGYQDNVVYRPMNEDVRDVTVSVEFKATNTPPGYPQIMSRIQQGTVQTVNVLDCYIFFISNQANNAVIGLQRGSAYLTTLKSIVVSPPVDTTHAFRLTLSASGANPVTLTGTVEMQSNNVWTKVGGGSVADNSAQRLDLAGSVGFGVSGGEVAALYSYDNFIRTSP